MVKCSIGCIKFTPVGHLVYFCLLNILMYIDRGVVAALVTSFEEDKNLRLTNTEAGVLGSVFMLGFMVASPLFANASQNIHAFTLITIGISMWACSCLLAGVSTTFYLLVIARALSGIGEASFVCLASPIILAKAPADKKNLWISLFYSALTIGYALGYVIAPPIKSGFGGWQYVFFLEMFASIPFIIIAFFAWRDPGLVFRKEQKESILVQIKELSKNSVYVFLVLGNGAYNFTVGGLAFWGPAILQREYDISETLASMSLGVITVISGLFATVTGSMILEKMTRPFRKEYEDGKITQKGLSYWITEKSSKLSMRVVTVAVILGLIGAIFAPFIHGPKSRGPFGFFITFLCLSEMSLFLGIGPLNMGVLNCVSEDLRPQAVAVSIFMMHLLGDFPSPFLIGVLNQEIGMYFATIILIGWMFFSSIFWFCAFLIARFHDAPKEYVKENLFSLKIKKGEHTEKLMATSLGVKDGYDE